MARGRQPSKIERDNVKGIEQLKNKFYSYDAEFMPTGVLFLDILLGGGIPRGKFIEFSSPSGLGKSTIMAFVSKNLCDDEKIVHWWDFEHALSRGLKDGVGLNQYEGNRFIHLEPITYGDAEEILEGMEESQLPDMIVVDSETAILPDKLKDVSILTMEAGIKSRLCSNFLLKYKGWARKNNVTIVFINQMRTKINMVGVTTEDSAGGNALRFYCDIRLRGRRVADIIQEQQTPEGIKKITCGVEAAIWAIKNKEVRSHVELTFPVIFGKGVSSIQIIRKLLVSNGLAISAGSYFKVNIEGVCETTVQGNKGLNQLIKENKAEIEKFIVEKGLLELVREPDEG